MKTRFFRTEARWRWVVAMGAILLLAFVSEAALGTSDQARQLGVTAAGRGDEIVVVGVYPGSWAWDAGVRPGDIVTAIDGRSVAPADTATAMAHAGSLETRATSGAVRRAPPGQVPLPASNAHRLSLAALAVGFLAIGVTVFALATELATSGALLGLSLSTSVMLVGGLAEDSGAAWSVILTYVAFVAFGASTLLLFLNFPSPRLSGRWLRVVLVAIAAIHGFLLVSYAWAWAVDNAAYDWVRKVLFAVASADLLGALALLGFTAAFARPDGSGQRALRLLVPGAIAAFAPFALLSAAPQAIGLGYVVAPDIAGLTLVFLPAAVGAAVLGRQWPGVDHLVRRSLVALGVWLTLLAVYCLLLYVPKYLFDKPEFPDYDMIARPLVVLFIAGTFPFAQGFLRRRFEQALFHDVYDYAATLREISGGLTQLTRTESIAHHTLSRLGNTLDLDWAAIFTPRATESVTYEWQVELPAFVVKETPTLQGPGDLASLQARAVASVDLIADDETVGRLLVGSKRHDLELLEDDRNLLATLAPMIAGALQNARLLYRLDRQVRMLREREYQLAELTVDLMHAHEEERARLALELHDDPLQRTLMLVRELGQSNGVRRGPQWRRQAEEIADSLKAISAGLHPPILEDLGLEPSLQSLLDTVRATSEIEADLDVRGTGGREFGRLDPDLELVIYRVAQEALNNCLKHSGATEVAVTLVRHPGSIMLRVVDNGTGLAPGVREDSGGHLGIPGMRERLRPWGGSLSMRSIEPHGTAVDVQVLLSRESAPRD